MKKVYLFCSAGMSTSMLAANMQQVANQHSLEMEVQAFPHDKLGEIISTLHPDCILLGPQVIDSGDYGMMNGEKVLKSAVKLMRAAGK